MEKHQLIGQAAVLLTLAAGAAFGLLAGTTPDTFDVETVSQAAGPEGGPRECDLSRGIDTACTFM